MVTQAAGARLDFTFTGTAVRWIAYRDPWCGIANLYVDGALVAQLDTYAADYLKDVVMYTVTGLRAGQHTLTIVATGTFNNNAHSAGVWLDAFDVMSASASPAQSAPQIWSSFLPTLTAAYTASTFTPSATIRITRIQVQIAGPSQTCATNPVVIITDGTSTGTRTMVLTAQANDSGVVAVDYAAETSITVGVNQPASCGGGTGTSAANVVVQYEMK